MLALKWYIKKRSCNMLDCEYFSIILDDLDSQYSDLGNLIEVKDGYNLKELVDTGGITKIYLDINRDYWLNCIFNRCGIIAYKISSEKDARIDDIFILVVGNDVYVSKIVDRKLGVSSAILDSLMCKLGCLSLEDKLVLLGYLGFDIIDLSDKIYISRNCYYEMLDDLTTAIYINTIILYDKASDSYSVYTEKELLYRNYVTTGVHTLLTDLDGTKNYILYKDSINKEYKIYGIECASDYIDVDGTYIVQQGMDLYLMCRDGVKFVIR